MPAVTEADIERLKGLVDNKVAASRSEMSQIKESINQRITKHEIKCAELNGQIIARIEILSTQVSRNYKLMMTLLGFQFTLLVGVFGAVVRLMMMQ